MFKEMIAKTKDFLGLRQQSYKLVFNPESIAAQRVLADLAKFCRADATTFHPDPRIHSALEGRREVFLRISNHLNLTPDELWKIYGNRNAEG